jgi:DNA mismatch repair protein MSH5
MIDLAQVSLALRGATSRSLIILDEFGKGVSLRAVAADDPGTAPADGLGLLAGVIQYLVDGPCPRTVILTHFQRVVHRRLISSGMSPADGFQATYSRRITSTAMLRSCTLIWRRCKCRTGRVYRTCIGKSHVSRRGADGSLRPSRCYTSYAAECALIHGIPKPVVDRAREVT